MPCNILCRSVFLYRFVASLKLTSEKWVDSNSNRMIWLSYYKVANDGDGGSVGRESNLCSVITKRVTLWKRKRDRDRILWKKRIRRGERMKHRHWTQFFIIWILCIVALYYVNDRWFIVYRAWCCFSILVIDIIASCRIPTLTIEILFDYFS